MPRDVPPRPTFWQRRWLLKHYERFGDEALSRVSGLPLAVVRHELGRVGAERTLGQQRRIERQAAGRSSPRHPSQPPSQPPSLPPPVIDPRSLRRLLLRCESRPLDGTDALLMLACLAGSLLLYGLTAARFVTGEDAGELIAAAHGLGVPHPPGYPLWTLLAHASSTWLPFSTIPFRVTLVSVVPAALANMLLLGVGLKTLASRWAACLAAGLFALSLTHWSQAVIPEVYGLNTLFMAAIVLLLIRFREQSSRVRLWSLAGVCGLSLTNHPTAMPVVALALGAALLISPSCFARPKVVLVALLLGLAPLLLYGYLPLAAARHPYLNWGHVDSPAALWAHVSRAQYAAVESSAVHDGSYFAYLRRLAIIGRSALQQMGGPWVLLLGAVGAVRLLAKQTGVWIVVLGIGWICSIGVTRFSEFSFDKEHVYANQIFFIPAWMALAWLAGGGLDGACSLIGRRSRWVRGALGAVVGAVVGLLLLVPPGLSHYARVDRSGLGVVESYGRALLDTMEPGSLYFPASDHSTFAVLYMQGVLGYRTDVVVADKYGELEPDVLAAGVGEPLVSSLEGLDGRARRRRLERELILNWPAPVYAAGRRELGDLPERSLEPCGPLYRFMTPEEAAAWWGRDPAAEGGQAEDANPTGAKPLMGPPAPPPGLAIWDRLPRVELDDPRQNLDFTVQMIRSDLLAMAGLALLKAGRLESALSQWSRIEGDLAPFKQIRNNLGAALAEAGHPEQGIGFLRQALEEDPEYLLALRNLAHVQLSMHARGEAIETLRRLLDAHPRSRVDCLDLARVLGQDGQLVASLSQYEALARQDMDDPLPWREAGGLLAEAGDGVKARQAYRESLARDPNQERVARALTLLQRGVGDESIADASITDASITDASITDASLADASVTDPSLVPAWAEAPFVGGPPGVAGWAGAQAALLPRWPVGLASSMPAGVPGELGALLPSVPMPPVPGAPGAPGVRGAPGVPGAPGGAPGLPRRPGGGRR